MCSAHNVAIYIGIRENSIGIKKYTQCSYNKQRELRIRFSPILYYSRYEKKVLVLKKTTLNAYFWWLCAGGLFDIIQSFVLKENQQRGLQQSNFFCVWHFLGVLSLSLTFDILDLGGGHKLLGSHCIVVMEHQALLSSMILIENVIGQQIERPIYKYYNKNSIRLPKLCSVFRNQKLGTRICLVCNMVKTFLLRPLNFETCGAKPQ